MSEIPTDLKSCVETIVKDLNEASINLIKTETPASVHFGYGMALRNDWKLWQKGSPLVNYFNERFGLGHADDMSGMIFSAVWAHVRQTPFDEDKEAERYRQYWRNQCTDPLTLQPLPCS